MAVDKNKIIAEATRLVQKGQYDKALKAYDKILAEDRKEVRILLKVGEIQQKKGDNAAAAATFNQVAEIYGDQGFFLKAVAVYKQIVKLTPDDIRVNEKLAGLYQQLGLLNDATNQLQAVAAAHEKAGDQGRHLDVLRRLLDLDPENIVTCQRLGDLYAKAGRTAEALELYRRASAHLRENKRGDEHLKLAERIFLLTPDDLKLARELAQEYLARGDTKKALGKLQACHGADKQDIDTLRLMAQAFRDLGQVSKTIAVYRALAHVYAERGRREESALTWRMVLDLLPDDLEATEELTVPDSQRAATATAAPPVGRPPGAGPAAGPPGAGADAPAARSGDAG
jgi:pilus assembly protein FimV